MIDADNAISVFFNNFGAGGPVEIHREFQTRYETLIKTVSGLGHVQSPIPVPNNGQPPTIQLRSDVDAEVWKVFKTFKGSLLVTYRQPSIKTFMHMFGSDEFFSFVFSFLAHVFRNNRFEEISLDQALIFVIDLLYPYPTYMREISKEMSKIAYPDKTIWDWFMNKLSEVLKVNFIIVHETPDSKHMTWRYHNSKYLTNTYPFVILKDCNNATGERRFGYTLVGYRETLESPIITRFERENTFLQWLVSSSEQKEVMDPPRPSPPSPPPKDATQDKSAASTLPAGKASGDKDKKETGEGYTLMAFFAVLAILVGFVLSQY